MKIYATADIHGSQYRLNQVLETIESEHPDLIIICGDITQFGPGDVAKQLLDQIPGDVLCIPGNIDTPDVWQGIEKSHAENIHRRCVTHKGLTFLGINGVDDAETELILTGDLDIDLPKKIDVMVSHVPPYGLQDKVFIGMHSGSKLLLELLNNLHPRLFLCGHIHEDPGYASHNNTVIINCSMGKRGRGAIIELSDELNVHMLK